MTDDIEHVYKHLRLMEYRALFETVKEKPGSLSATEAFSAEVIYLLGGPSVSEFASFLGISQPNASYKINALADKGYIDRGYGADDRRECRLTVTKKFFDYYGGVMPLIDRELENAQRDFDPQERALVQKLIKRMSDNMCGKGD